MTLLDARAFFLDYNNESYYESQGRKLLDGEMIEYGGDTIAIVDDAGNLTIYNQFFFVDSMKGLKVKFLSAADYARKHGRQSSAVRKLCREGRIRGAQNTEAGWVIPEDSPYPTDARFGKRVRPLEE